MTTPAVEDYLKAIHQLSREGSAAATSAIAERLGVAAGSVSGMLRRLADQGLIEHVPYYGARLTPAGEAEAVRMIRRHRVLELFLVEVLGYTWDRVHAEAEHLEHAASDEIIDRMATVLGEPAFDPHGAEIPELGRTFAERRYPTLADLEVGRLALLREVSDEDPAALRDLAQLGLLPGVELMVLERPPPDGPLRVRVAGTLESVAREISRLVRVEPIDPAEPTDRP